MSAPGGKAASWDVPSRGGYAWDLHRLRNVDTILINHIYDSGGGSLLFLT